MFYENIDGHRMLFILFVNHEGLVVKSVVRSNLGDFGCVIILQLVDISDHFALVGTDGSKK
jgi:hypothetical protein